jgi:hypothetical protein
VKQKIINSINSYKEQGIDRMPISNILSINDITVETQLEFDNLYCVLDELCSAGVISDLSTTNLGWGRTGNDVAGISYSKGAFIGF